MRSRGLSLDSQGPVRFLEKSMNNIVMVWSEILDGLREKGPLVVRTTWRFIKEIGPRGFIINENRWENSAFTAIV